MPSATNDAELSLGTLFTGRVDQTFRRAAGQLRSIMVGLATAQAKYSKEMGATDAATGKARKQAKGLADEYTNVGKRLSMVHGGMQRLTNAMKVTASYGLAGTAIFTFINALKEGTGAIFDYDQSLKNLQAITGATDAEIGAMAKTIRKVASETKYSVREVSDAAILLGQAGFTAEETLDALDAVAKLATGTLSDMKVTSDLLTTTIRAFGLQATESGRVADIFAGAINRSKLDVDKLRIAFNYLAPVAKKAGLSIEETAAGAMVLANAGIRASTIGTGFRQVLARLLAPTDKLRAAFLAAGADMSKLNPAMSDMSTIIGELVKIVPNAQRAFELFGLRGAPAVAVFTEVGVKGFQAMLKETYRVGAAAEMAEKQIEGLGIMAKNLRDKLGLLAVGLGEGGIAAAFRLFLSVARPAVDILTMLAETLAGKATVAIVALTAAITALHLAFRYLFIQMAAISFGTTISAIKVAVAWMGAYTVATDAATAATKRFIVFMKANPFLFVAAGISAAVVAIMTYIDHLDKKAKLVQQDIIETNKHVKVLEDYRTKLSQVKEGSMEHSSTMQRLIGTYKELGDQVDITTMKWKDEGEALDELIEKKRAESIAQQADLVAEYKNRIDRLASSIRALSDQDLWGNFVPLDALAIEAAATRRIQANAVEQGLAIRDLAESLKKYVGAGTSAADIATLLVDRFNVTRDVAGVVSGKLAEYFEQIQLSMLNTKDVIKQLSFEWAELYSKADDSKRSAIFDLFKKYNIEFQKMMLSVDDLEERETRQKMLYEQYLREAMRVAGVEVDIGKKTTEQMLKQLDLRIEEEKRKYADLASALESAYVQDMMNHADSEADKKVITAKFQRERLELEEKRLKDSVANEEARLTILQDLRRDELENIENFYDTQKSLIEDHHKVALDAMEARLKEELLLLDMANLSERDLFAQKQKLRDNFRQRENLENNRYADDMLAILKKEYDARVMITDLTVKDEDKKAKKIRDLTEKLHASQRKIYQDRYQQYRSMIDKLIGEEERLFGEFKELREEQKEIERNTEEAIRGIRYGLLRDTEKAYKEDQRARELIAEATRAYAEGHYGEAKEKLREAQKIDADIAKLFAARKKEAETLDAAGQQKVYDELSKFFTSRGITVALDSSIFERGMDLYADKVREVGNALLDMNKEQQKIKADGLQRAQEQAASLSTQMETFLKQIDQVSTSQLGLDVSPAVSAVSEVLGKITTLKEELSKLDGKTITLNIIRKVTEAVAGVASGVAQAVPQFASGTGPSGLPRTGIFHGDEGEIVLNKAESDAYRKGDTFTGQLHTIKIESGKDSATIYGTSDGVRDLVKVLKRERLVTA